MQHSVNSINSQAPEEVRMSLPIVEIQAKEPQEREGSNNTGHIRSEIDSHVLHQDSSRLVTGKRQIKADYMEHPDRQYQKDTKQSCSLEGVGCGGGSRVRDRKCPRCRLTQHYFTAYGNKGGY